MFGFDPLIFWGWTFLALYMGMMLLFGVIGMRRVRSSDDFATARASYGPLFLAFAMTATTASGATFLAERAFLKGFYEDTKDPRRVERHRLGCPGHAAAHGQGRNAGQHHAPAARRQTTLSGNSGV